jgi:hypothetical protein
MSLAMKEPAELARRAEDSPQLPAACERVSGYGVMGLPFRSGHVLGLRRWTASSIGEPFTSIWHRDPAGRWTFYETERSEIACTRYFGAEVDRVQIGPIELDWRMGRVAGWTLRAGTVKLTGMTSNQQHFDANPLRIWCVTDSHALVAGEELGPIGPLAEQAHLTDFYIPQRGIFAIGRVFLTPVTEHVPAEAAAGFCDGPRNRDRRRAAQARDSLTGRQRQRRA